MTNDQWPMTNDQYSILGTLVTEVHGERCLDIVGKSDRCDFVILTSRDGRQSKLSSGVSIFVDILVELTNTVLQVLTSKNNHNCPVASMFNSMWWRSPDKGCQLLWQVSLYRVSTIIDIIIIITITIDIDYQCGRDQGGRKTDTGRLEM